MNYVLFGILVYLALGVYLTRSILTIAPMIRMRFRDFAVGAVLMPVVLVLALLLILFDELWTRLLIVLGFDPPEKMRAGPDAPASHDSGRPGLRQDPTEELVQLLPSNGEAQSRHFVDNVNFVIGRILAETSY